MTCRQVRASYSETTITVYQAYSPQIADAALAAQTFVFPFKRNRMTWIKPSFLWMMYRSGWASKSGQERILAIELTRSGFEWALAHSTLSHYDPASNSSHEEWLLKKQTSPVVIQWDPDRSISLERLTHRAIQVGLGGQAVDYYLEQWIVGIVDVTLKARKIKHHLDFHDVDAARAELPTESTYPLPDHIRARIGASRP